jgi:glucose/arabinose dehydrogenase
VYNPHDPNTTVDSSSMRELLRIDKPEFNHNGGTLAVGPDGDLYLSLGDGGFGDDQGPGHVAGGNAQSLAPGNVLGKILRIDPRGHNSVNGRYGIPRDNPFVGKPGADEIWAYGLRNPYRISFDPVSGRLYAADTGQDNVEEVDVIWPGANYGWHIKEGTFDFHPGSPRSAVDSWVTPGTRTPRLTGPIAEYDHTGPHGTVNGEATVGGFVYRGRSIPALSGRYVFGDYSREADTFGPAARLWYVNGNSNPRHAVTAIRVNGKTTMPLLLLGFGRDANGELYAMGNTNGQVTGHTGVVYRLARH